MADDLQKKLDALLSSPDSLQQIAQMMASLGGTEDTAPPAPPTPPPSDTPDLSMLLKLAPLLSSLTAENEHTALLKALRPYLHGEREKRLDESLKLLRMLELLPLLKEGGLLK